MFENKYICKASTIHGATAATVKKYMNFFVHKLFSLVKISSTSAASFRQRIMLFANYRVTQNFVCSLTRFKAFATTCL